MKQGKPVLIKGIDDGAKIWHIPGWLAATKPKKSISESFRIESWFGMIPRVILFIGRNWLDPSVLSYYNDHTSKISDGVGLILSAASPRRATATSAEFLISGTPRRLILQ